MGLFGYPTTTITGSSTAQAGLTTNINFYLLLDNSPSMNIAATTAGINTMVANTSAQGGCAFACHESDPAADNLGNPGGVDNYTLAQNLGVVTRMQNLATRDPGADELGIVDGGIEPAVRNGDLHVQRFRPQHHPTADLQSRERANRGGQYQRRGSLLQQLAHQDEPEQRHRYRLRNRHVVDQRLMPLPGTGTPASTPQEVLFIVTDGVDDEVSSSCSQSLDGNRCQQPFSTTWCTTVKNRGIQIAVLYTEYLPLPTNSWYNDWIAPFQSQISPNMQSCASPGMFFSVTTDGDITAAMQTLFQQAVAAARLTK